MKALPAQIFTDDFSTGNLSKWAVTGSLVIDTTRGQPAASARGPATNAKAMASRTLPSTYGSLCMSTAVHAVARFRRHRPVPPADLNRRPHREGVCRRQSQGLHTL